MKIPYIKLYTADLLAASRNLTAQQIGEAMLGLCESAFENDTAYVPQTAREETFFEMLLHWKEESLQALEQNKKKMKKARSMRWAKKENTVGQSLKNNTQAAIPQHTETKTETKPYTETKTENINILTAQADAAQTKSALSQEKKEPPKTLLEQFSKQVLEHFESAVQTPEQKHIWFKRNCRCLSDILNFCNRDITLALQTIRVCILRLKKAGLSGGYEAVCRNLPEYMAQAQQELEEAYGYTK